MKTHSPYARMSRVTPDAFKFADGFWMPRIEALKSVSLPGQFKAMEATGRIDNFRWAAGQGQEPHQGLVFNDSDVYKWLEAAAYAGKNPSYDNEVDALIGWILKSQQPDGYLNTAFMYEKSDKRWTNIRDDHELYCAGHFIEAAIALSDSGDHRLLAAAQRFADLICELFGPEEEGKRSVVPGHEEIELALVALYRATGDEKYLNQAKYFLMARGKGLIGGLQYHQDHVPFVSLEKMIGHAVRAIYLNIAAADIFLETGDESLKKTLERLWDRLYTRQVYITGGLGARHSGEAFGEDFELPNEQAYSETCAAVASIFWNQRMLHMTGDVKYADAIETTLFNAALAGISMEGGSYFYTNPLSSEGTHRRAQYFNCACCPPNIARLLAGLSSYMFSIGNGELWIHQYAAGTARLYIGDQEFCLRIQTDYPLSGKVQIEVETAGEWTLHLRVPGWAANAVIYLNDRVYTETDGGYMSIARHWSVGDRLSLDLPMAPRFVRSHPAVVNNIGRVAVMMGPLVYCVESGDIALDNLRIATDKAPQLIPGKHWHNLKLSAIIGQEDSGWSTNLYRSDVPLSDNFQTAEVIAKPYFSWANEDPKSMRVWLKEK